MLHPVFGTGLQTAKNEMGEPPSSIGPAPQIQPDRSTRSLHATSGWRLPESMTNLIGKMF